MRGKQMTNGDKHETNEQLLTNHKRYCIDTNYDG